MLKLFILLHQKTLPNMIGRKYICLINEDQILKIQKSQI